MTETAWLPKCKIFTIWSFTESMSTPDLYLAACPTSFVVILMLGDVVGSCDIY